jgi:hypothetical protein
LVALLLGGAPTSLSGVGLDTRWVALGVVGLLVAVGFSLFLLRKSTHVATASVFIPNPANDTVVICRGWDELELTTILGDFARSYHGRLPSSQPFSVERERDQFRIHFPGDIAPPMLSFLVNYLQYPKNFDLTNRHIAAVGIVTLTKAFPIGSDGLVGKQARVYVPSDDQRYDEVYVAVGSQYFRQRFTDMRWISSVEGRIPDGIEELR